MSKRSLVWKYFKKVGPGDDAECSICKAKIKAQGRNTSNLKRHLGRHESESKKLQEDEAARKLSENSTSQQPSIEQALDDVARIKKSREGAATDMWPHSHPRAIKITEKLTKMICVDYQPYSIVEDEGFSELLNTLEPRYKVPTRQQLSSEIVPARYKNTKAKIVSMIMADSVRGIALTTDGWTSRATDAYLSLTAHYVDPATFEMMNLCLAVRSWPEKHTGKNLVEFIRNTLAEYNINIPYEAAANSPARKSCTMIPIYCTTDNAANITSALEMLGPQVERISCFAHTLQLVVKDGLEQFRGIASLRTKGKKIVSHFKRSSNAKNELNVMQKRLNLPEHKLKLDVSTRWNSTLYMIQRLVEQKSAISSVLASVENVPNLSPHEWKIAEQLIPLLLPFEEATQLVSGQRYPTLSMVIPILKEVESKLKANTDFIDLKNAFLLSMQKRWPNLENNATYTIATVVDPRFKLVPFDQNKRTDIAARVLQAMKELQVTTAAATESDEGCRSKGSSDQPKEQQATSGSFWSSFQAKVQAEYGKSSSSKSDTEMFDLSCKQELDQFLQQTPIELRNNPLKWWKENRASFPNLANVAQRMFSVPATSVPSEQLFSKAGIIVSERRCSLKGSHVEELTFLKQNWKF